MVEYAGGDACEWQPGAKYSTQIHFKCNIEQDSENTERPIFLEREGCRFVFEWVTDKACPICLKNQVEETRGPCESIETDALAAKGAVTIDPDGNRIPLPKSQKIGLSKVALQPLPGVKCYVPSTKEMSGSKQWDIETYSASLKEVVT